MLETRVLKYEFVTTILIGAFGCCKVSVLTPLWILAKLRHESVKHILNNFHDYSYIDVIWIILTTLDFDLRAFVLLFDYCCF